MYVIILYTVNNELITYSRKIGYKIIIILFKFIHLISSYMCVLCSITSISPYPSYLPYDKLFETKQKKNINFVI